MARRPRNETFVPGHPHHIVMRGNNRRVIFRERDQSRERFVDWLYEAADKHDTSLHQLHLMSNHLHLGATSPTLLAHSKFVQSFAQRFARWHNKTHGGSGCLFEERHYAKALRNEAHAAATTAYIDLNGVRAGMAESPLDCAWSTHAIHAGMPALSKLDPARWKPIAWYETLGADDESRAQAYRAWVEARRAEPAPDPRLPELERWSEERWRKRERWLRRPDGSRVCEETARYLAAGGEWLEDE